MSCFHYRFFGTTLALSVFFYALPLFAFDGPPPAADPEGARFGEGLFDPPPEPGREDSGGFGLDPELLPRSKCEGRGALPTVATLKRLALTQSPLFAPEVMSHEAELLPRLLKWMKNAEKEPTLASVALEYVAYRLDPTQSSHERGWDRTILERSPDLLRVFFALAEKNPAADKDGSLENYFSNDHATLEPGFEDYWRNPEVLMALINERAAKGDVIRLWAIVELAGSRLQSSQVSAVLDTAFAYALSNKFKRSTMNRRFVSGLKGAGLEFLPKTSAAQVAFVKKR